MTETSGILIIDKPSGWTSFDVVAKVRRVFGVKRVGHAGTLDPLATGVLVVLVGKATKLSDKLLAQDKIYQATIRFGQQTDTGDADGTVIATDDATWLTQPDVERVLPTLLGTRPQQVPAYSAVKMNGRKLYELARQGKAVADRPSRTITISSINLDQFDPTPPHPQATLTIACSKGTYIRVVAEELAEKLGTTAHLTALRRLASGPFTLTQAHSIAQLTSSEHPEQWLHPLTA